MHENFYFATTAVGCHLLLGFVVFITNPHRTINRSFLLLTLVVGGWISSIQVALLVRDGGAILFWMRMCSAWGTLVPTAFLLLRISILYPEERWRSLLWRLRWWIVLSGAAAAFCLSPLCLKGVVFGTDPVNAANRVPQPLYGSAAILYSLYVAFAVGAASMAMFRDQYRPQSSGVHHVELQFVWLGSVIIALSALLSYGAQVLLHAANLIRYAAPLRVIAFDIIIAYGITSRGILQIRVVVRLALSYLLLAIYSGALFTLAWFALRWFFVRIGIDEAMWPTILAGTLAAVLINTAATPLRRVARSILPPNDLDVERIVSKVGNLLRSVATLNELLREFSSIIGKAVGAPEVYILLPGVRGFCEPCKSLVGGFTGDEVPSKLCLGEDDPIVVGLRSGRHDIAMEELVRHAASAQERALLSRLQALNMDLIVPAHYRGELSAIVLFPPRHGGRIYGGDGRSTLRLISEQLGVAIVNAHLYTEAQQSQAYNRLLVEHLPCGVITMDRGGTVNVINPEARRLLQVDEQAAPGEVDLPPELMELVRSMRCSERDPVGEEIVLRPNARDQAHLRAYCLPFTGEEGERLGTVLVLNDHTTLERLQRQVRQADRLASIGTLASGMAHEIKNPLTALKTFTQLLPKRYDDAEFRSDFSGLAGSEIARIERIVNQLLAFARPAPLMIEQVNLHEVIESAMRLVGPQAARQNVTIRKSFGAHQDFIAADKDRLQQVLLNLILNALQASSEDSWIELSTELEPVAEDQDPLIRLDVRDAGSGIAADKLPHIFDPFFTTKSEGTGLGLSVSYNIVAEHKGRLEVQSEPGKGTCFSIYLPVH